MSTFQLLRVGAVPISGMRFTSLVWESEENKKREVLFSPSIPSRTRPVMYFGFKP